MGPMISVIIPARDSEQVIGPCLDSLAGQTLKPGEVIVVDDGSEDGTGRIVAEDYNWARLITLSESRGFSGACIAGFEASKGDWIALLNADTVADPGWLKELTKAIKTDSRAGMIASRVLLAEPAGHIDSLGLKINRGGMASLRGHGEQEDAVGAPDLMEVFGPAGSACLLSREMLEECGFFEPSFEAYYEDVDLAFRCRRQGWKSLLANRARVVHRHSHSYGKDVSKKRFYLQRNRLRTIIRNWSWSWIIIDLPFLAAYDLASIAVALREGSLGAPFKARLDFICSLPRDLATRREILLSRKVGAKEMRAWLK